MSPKRKHADKNSRDALNGTAASPRKKRARLETRGKEHDSSPAKPDTTTASTTAMYQFPSKRDPVVLSPSSPGPSKHALRTTANMNTNGGPKRMLVKNLKIARKVDPKVYLDQTWDKLQAALDTVFAGGKIDFSLEELYRGVENLCRQKMAKDVYDRLEKTCKEHIAGLRKQVEQTAARPDVTNVDVLRATLQVWEEWMKQVKLVLWIFCYLDRTYLLPMHDALQLRCIDFFRDGIVEQKNLTQSIIDGACDILAAYREGQEMDSHTFAEAVAMFYQIHVYTTMFEPRMLELSQSYIAAWANKESHAKSLPEYVKAAHALIQTETSRADAFKLSPSTKTALTTLLYDLVISKQETRLTLEEEFAELLKANAVDDLKLLYGLLDIRELTAGLRPGFMKWIEGTGTAIVFDEKEQDSMVIKLLSLKQQLDTIWKDCFKRNVELGHGLREAFETFMNKTKKSSGTWGTDNNKPGEMIAKYVDTLLRGGAKAIPTQLSRKAEKPAAVEEVEDNEDVMMDEDAEVNNQLDQVLDLFRFVHGKAVFEAFYKKDLARRLLMGRSASADAERSMLAKLKTECGAGFTANLEQMFKDIELSREEMSSYKSIMEERKEKLSIDLNVNVLSASAWPTYPTVPVIIPPQIKSAIDKFEKHYYAKHSGRKLDWKHALAHCQVKAKFPRGSKELVVSSFQAIVLLLFNDVKEDEHLDYNYLKEATGLPPAELNRTLQSLACAKLRPLTKHPKGREIDPSDTFTLNANFTDPKYRIKINTVQLKETQAENKETHERVAADRNYETQAAIVRIMKREKTIGHAQLIAETIKETRSRGQLDVGGIKRNIDRLIEKDYMEREEDGRYSYIA